MASRHASKRLTHVFLAWKIVLFAVAYFSPGLGYDTSGLIASNPSNLRHTEFKSLSTADRISLKLLSWDALYFVKSAQRGYRYEQEWAFSWAYSLVLRNLIKLVPGDNPPSLHSYVWAGIFISNISHLASVLILYRLSNVLLGPQQSGRVPFVASILHVLSPAGMFLSSPYAESVFAALNFAGMLLYAQARTLHRSYKQKPIHEDVLVVGAAMLFTLATWIRSNGLLSGTLFLLDAVSFIPGLVRTQLSIYDVRRFVITCASGVLLGIGSMIPQYIAYQEYCLPPAGASARPWCSKTIPSIYTWVQRHYWNVGFLRYWTLSNLPLFLIAGPMLWLLLRSSIEYLRDSTQQPRKPSNTRRMSEERDSQNSNTTFGNLPQLAWPQLVLAITAATNFHVQVINRLSSGYPVWYLAVARWATAQSGIQRSENQRKVSQWICRGMIIYALVQGALFANFLPPA